MSRKFDLACFASRNKGIDPFESITSDATNGFFASTSHALKDVIFQPLVGSYEIVRFDAINEIVLSAHNSTAMALGRQALFKFRRKMMEHENCYADDALGYLSNPQASPVDRISFLEFVLSASKHVNPAGYEEMGEFFPSVLQSQSLQLIYNDGQFDPSAGPILQDAIHDPFWSILEDSKWDNVRTDMEQALSLRDSGGPNPSLYAARSLESAIKIVSHDHGWATGGERGAANYVDTLVSSKNGRFIEVWEGDMLKRFFGDVRNPGCSRCRERQTTKAEFRSDQLGNRILYDLYQESFAQDCVNAKWSQQAV